MPKLISNLSATLNRLPLGRNPPGLQVLSQSMRAVSEDYLLQRGDEVTNKGVGGGITEKNGEERKPPIQDSDREVASWQLKRYLRRPAENSHLSELLVSEAMEECNDNVAVDNLEERNEKRTERLMQKLDNTDWDNTFPRRAYQTPQNSDLLGIGTNPGEGWWSAVEQSKVSRQS